MIPEQLDIDLQQLTDGGVDLNNYCGIWCVDESRFSQLLWQFQSMDFANHLSRQEARSFEPTAKEFSTVGQNGSVAVITVSGAMTKKGSSMSQGGSTLRARYALKQAARDSGVDSIILRVDSPGGTVSGTADLAADIARINQNKPIFGYVEDLAASAAYWAISQCSAVYANSETAQIGSIGTFLGLFDLSGKAEKEGIKPVVIKTGEFKGGGFPGTEITEGQIAEWQKMVDAIQVQFAQGVATGRGMSLAQVNDVATGSTFIASDAKSLGLIDGVRSFDSIVEELQSKQPKKGRVAMSEQSPAMYSEIVATCHGIDTSLAEDAMFVTDCLSKSMTTEKASESWFATLTSRVSTAREELATAQAENAELKSKVDELETENTTLKQQPKAKGVPAVGTTRTESNSTGNDPVSEWNAAITEKVKSGMTRANAAKAVNRENPELRQSLVAASN